MNTKKNRNASDPESHAEFLDGEASGYIIEGGSIITIEEPKLDSANKMAIDIIKAKVIDYATPEKQVVIEHDENDLTKLQDNLMKTLEKNIVKEAATGKISGFSQTVPSDRNSRP